MINKHIYSTHMYISLLINVSVSLMVSGVLPHMTEGITQFQVPMSTQLHNSDMQIAEVPEIDDD